MFSFKLYGSEGYYKYLCPYLYFQIHNQKYMFGNSVSSETFQQEKIKNRESRLEGCVCFSQGDVAFMPLLLREAGCGVGREGQ